MEKLDSGQAPSQRDLARSLNMSLGLVNAFIKRLAHKGYFKITTVPQNRVRYMLTPKGMAEKTRLTYEYLQYSLKYYKNARAQMRALFHILAEQGARTVVFIGAGELAEIAFISLQETPILLAAIADDRKTGKKFLGFTVKPQDDVSNMACDKILITDMEEADTIRNRLKEKGVAPEKIILLGPV